MKYYESGNYLVKGRRKSCLYNVKTQKVHRFNNDLLEHIIQIFESDDNHNKELLTYFSNNAIDISPKGIKAFDELTEDSNITCSDFFVWISLTTRCNLQCVHCYEESNKCGNDMTFELFKKIIDNIQSLGIKKISLIGGEPLMNKDLLKMVQYTENKFSYVELFTNGTLLNERLLLELKPYITQFAFSIYSMEKNKHNSITRSDNSHRLTLNAIQLVKKHKVKYRTSTILMKSLEFKDYEIIKKNNSLSSLDVIRLSGRANFGLLNAELIKSKLITPKKFRKVIDEKVFLKRLKFHNCFSEKMYIDYDGEVYPCVMERSMSHGNVERGFFEFGLSDEITMFTKDRISGCSECEYRYFCDDCRPDRSSDSNNEKPWYCTYEPRSGNWINTEDFIDAILNGSNE